MDDGAETDFDGNGPSDARLAAVLRLATTLSDRALDAQIMKRPVPDDQVKVLADAAALLQDHAIPLPPLLTQVLHEIGAARITAVVGSSASAEQTRDGEKAKGFARLMRAFQGRK